MYNFQLVKQNFSKKEFITLLKSYIKKLLGHLKEKNPSREAAFKDGATKFVKFCDEKFDELEL